MLPRRSLSRRPLKSKLPNGADRKLTHKQYAGIVAEVTIQGVLP